MRPCARSAWIAARTGSDAERAPTGRAAPSPTPTPVTSAQTIRAVPKSRRISSLVVLGVLGHGHPSVLPRLPHGEPRGRKLGIGKCAHGDRDDFWFRGIQVVDGRATPRTEVKVPPLAVIGDPNELARLA